MKQETRNTKQEARNMKNVFPTLCFLLRALCLMLLLILFFPVSVYCEDQWKLLFQPRERIVRAIAVLENHIFVGTGNGVFLSKDEGKTWQDFGTKELQKDTSGNSTINWIFSDKLNKKIYIATNFGAYYSDINKPDWRKFFESTKAGLDVVDQTTEDVDSLDEEEVISKIEEEGDFLQTGQVNSITIDDEQAYLSTNDGFWICSLKNPDNKCERLNEGLEPDNLSGNYEIFYALKADKNLFLSASNGIYKFDNKSLSWIKISSEIQDSEDGRINARYLYLDNEQNLWALCQTGIYKSSDKGESWKRISDGIKKNNEGFQEANYLFESSGKEGRLYAACANGIYCLDKKKNIWQNISAGIRTKEGSKNVYWISGLNGNLLAATGEGLFVAQSASQDMNDASESEVPEPRFLKGKVEADFSGLEELEPSLIEVQKQALKFAALPTEEDYKRYRLQARLRNLVPKVGFDINTTGSNTNYYQFENGISANTSLSNDYNAGNTKRFQRDGKMFQQLSVSWDANQILYDDTIWRILNQARLTANIKENLLDDVTRIYYQRKRLQLDSLLSPSKGLDGKLSREIEIAELTGQLDSRTGGWFSKEIKKRKRLLGEN